MLEEFEKYISSYNLDQSYMKLKHDHSVRVMELMGKYAKELGYSEDDVELAKLIGLLHDIGRFEQYKVFSSDVDHETVDHSDYSVVQLFDKNEIELFTNREDWYPIIEFAIKNHNKRVIPECSDERVLKFARLIRDIDKLDIIYLLGYLKLNMYKDAPYDITKEVSDYIFKHETVDVTKCCNDNDVVLGRNKELDNIIEVLCCKNKNNPLLILIMFLQLHLAQLLIFHLFLLPIML